MGKNEGGSGLLGCASLTGVNSAIGRQNALPLREGLSLGLARVSLLLGFQPGLSEERERARSFVI